MLYYLHRSADRELSVVHALNTALEGNREEWLHRNRDAVLTLETAEQYVRYYILLYIIVCYIMHNNISIF